MTEVAHTEGRWVGVVESVKLQDRRGQLYDGIVLASARGTPLKESVEARFGGGQAPILVGQDGSNLRALPRKGDVA